MTLFAYHFGNFKQLYISPVEWLNVHVHVQLCQCAYVYSYSADENNSTTVVTLIQKYAVFSFYKLLVIAKTAASRCYSPQMVFYKASRDLNQKLQLETSL